MRNPRQNYGVEQTKAGAIKDRLVVYERDFVPCDAMQSTRIRILYELRTTRYDKTKSSIFNVDRKDVVSLI